MSLNFIIISKQITELPYNCFIRSLLLLILPADLHTLSHSPVFPFVFHVNFMSYLLSLFNSILEKQTFSQYDGKYIDLLC